MKKCIQCGAALPERASFCPYCTATLIERHEVTMPPKRRRWGILALAAVALAAVAAAVWILPKEDETIPQRPPETVPVGESLRPGVMAEGTEYPYYITYNAEDGNTYWLYTGYTPSKDETAQPEGESYRITPENGGNDSPVTLYVTDEEGRKCAESFRPMVKEYTVEVVHQDHPGTVELHDPSEMETEELFTPSGALYYKRYNYKGAEGISVIRWTLQMNNGDTLLLEQTFVVSIQQTITYSWEEIPMETAEELQAVFDEIDQLDPAEYYVTVKLPAATYDVPLACHRQVEIFGQKDRTIFTAGLVLMSEDHSCVIRNLSFIGDGGTALTAGMSVYAYHCVFSGWDVGALVINGGWMRAYDSTFANNAVGIRYDSEYCTEFGPQCLNNAFCNNTVAIDIRKLIPQAWLEPTECTFTGNEEDIRNPDGYRVEAVSCTYG